ncbi:hypothetical protein BVC80_9099g32 [Macleaya cordata]|uniref:BLISTER n=1 Tax=Macleaya cordata TaxID=56857 RepID=A0A200PVN1_MACCD|nr:hypothetical protein BVC80_9099g32 [Macleaya cordata]
MASAQVMPNSGSSSRVQNLEAGRRKLQEFRNKRAGGRAKKVGLPSQTQSTDVSQNRQQSQDRESVRLPDSDGAATSQIDGSYEEPSAVVIAGVTEAIDSSQTTELGSSSGAHTSPPVSTNMLDTFYADPVQQPAIDQESRWYDGSRLPEPLYVNYDHLQEENNHNLGNPGTREPAYEVTMDQSVALNPVYGTGGIDRNAHQSSYYSIVEDQLRQDGISSQEYSVKAPDTSVSSEKSVSVPVKNDVGFGSTSTSGSISTLYSATNLTESVPDGEKYMRGGLDFSGATILDGRRQLSSSINYQAGTASAPRQSSESHSTDFSLDFRNSSNHVPLYTTISETGNRRSRPSFLDSINVTRFSSDSHSSVVPEKSEPFSSKSSKVNNQDSHVSSASRWPITNTVTVGPFDNLKTSNLLSTSEPLINPSVSLGNGGELLRQSVNDNSVDRKHDSPLLKHDENFAALEQHIEDLTQEKFSLQRALDASRTLAESLAAENSSLTDSYNQQGTIVNQLKSDMERLQEEIRVQLLEIESVKMEYANAQLECTAADERSKILASEVIGLEEKALRLRSSELKLERQLENSYAEITSYKKKVSILEKERQDLQFTINALQEEKKLLQSKLRKASGGGKSIDLIKTPSVMKDISTSTEDLGDDVSNLVHAELGGRDTISIPFDPEQRDVPSFLPSSSSTLPENSQFHLSVSSATIPPDQLKMIGNINSLISELALEKEELMRALASESSNSSNLKELNKELSHKLEAQTQRLELLTAQSMVNENIQARQTDPLTMNDSTAYTDEGDEVVERVLGWIMKLFPGGPSKRRTSKLL